MQKAISVWAVAIVSWLPFWEYVRRVDLESFGELFIMFCLMGLRWGLTGVVWSQFEEATSDDDEKPIIGYLCACAVLFGVVVSGFIHISFSPFAG